MTGLIDYRQSVFAGLGLEFGASCWAWMRTGSTSLPRRFYFGDISNETSNWILITEALVGMR